MFIRYNQAAKYYEYDTSAGQTGAGPWLILPIDYAQIYNPPAPSLIPHHITHEPGGSDALTALSGNIITTGTVADARLSANVALLNRDPQTFSGENKFTPGIAERGRAFRLGEWVSFVPVWKTLSDPQPVLGNGTSSGKYTLIGKTCHFWQMFNFGSTTTFGTGPFTFDLPITASALTPDGAVLGSAQLTDLSIQSYLGCMIQIVGSKCLLQTASSGYGTPTVPFTWTNGDVLRFNGSYEIA